MNFAKFLEHSFYRRSRGDCFWNSKDSLLTFTYLKSKLETLEKRVKNVQH